jgi:hypothetical protein
MPRSGRCRSRPGHRSSAPAGAVAAWLLVTPIGRPEPPGDPASTSPHSERGLPQHSRACLRSLCYLCRGANAHAPPLWASERDGTLSSHGRAAAPLHQLEYAGLTDRECAVGDPTYQDLADPTSDHLPHHRLATEYGLPGTGRADAGHTRATRSRGCSLAWPSPSEMASTARNDPPGGGATSTAPNRVLPATSQAN